ncbi:MAG: DEAD/DEAH box helicase family protein [Gemmatimonadetes bacterium]|nr:DEAD/DEAH box helicase family protein [Gemmatimonadota bacterium]
MTLHREIRFEEEICAHLAAHGWLYAAGDTAGYDRGRALYPDDVLAWVQASQPDAWETLQHQHGTSARETLLDRLRSQLDARGTLEVLRAGVDLLGLKARLAMAQFRPAFGLNADILARYAANRLRVVRQVRYSKHNENEIDLVLFLNGIAVATAELKTDFTQRVEDAVDQYRYDRHPYPKGRGPEPLLAFPQGALVHFAVSNSEVCMTTRLAGAETVFLPFNQGDGGGKGNPVNSAGHRTAYLWEEVWARDSWLEILGRYLVPERDAKKQMTRVLFPRYHQLDVTRKLQAAVLADGPGTKYLVQHSAGSGKTNSIAWTAHFLADLHDAEHRKVFHTVLVVSDRNVIDGQLQDAIFSFERKTGVVATVKGDGKAKSAELAEALKGDKKIVVCTIQTFPFALEAVRALAATEGKRFAVLADEAHSSQTGEAAAKLKELLSADELAALRDGGEVSTEDILAAQMSARADERNITFVAFTATPKNKTLELFGTRPNPARKPAPDNVPVPFHVYSMRQAIEEGFILDVLQNYTSYMAAFNLAHAGGGAAMDEREVERSAAMRGIMGWVRLHPYNIAQKVQVIVEHYRTTVAPLLNGTAKAMVVVGSRKEAVRWQRALQAYIREKGYALQSLVAFSGEVMDEESGPDAFTETSPTLNPGLKGRDIREAFKGPEFQILLAANKFQTGFDQPLLCAMYVDKRLDGIQAVQTLSRLNRAYPGKDTTYVVDFVNEPEDVLAAFRVYYETATLETTTDPHLVYDLRAKLDAAGYYDDFEVDRVAAVELDPSSKQSDLLRALEPVVDRLTKQFGAAQAAWRSATAAGDDAAADAAKQTMEALELFKRDVAAFVRLYTFLSQVFDYRTTDLEKRAIFYKHLVRLLDFGREREGIDLSKLELTHYALRYKGTSAPTLAREAPMPLPPISEAGSGAVQAREKARLAEIIERVNDLFTGELTETDRLTYVTRVIKGKLLESPVLRQQAQSNSKEQFAASPDLPKANQEAIMAALDAHTAMSTQALNSPAIQKAMLEILLKFGGLYEELRGEAA